VEAMKAIARRLFQVLMAFAIFMMGALFVMGATEVTRDPGDGFGIMAGSYIPVFLLQVLQYIFFGKFHPFALFKKDDTNE
jgi:hypothetical protein